MLEKMAWEQVYDLWKHSVRDLSKSLNEKPGVEFVPVKFKSPGSVFYGFDWRKAEEKDRVNQLVKQAMYGYSFFYDEERIYAGTLHTAELLSVSETEEDRAAIWIAATAFELKGCNTSDRKFYRLFYDAALGYLKERYEIWHYAMRKLVPGVPIASVLPDDDIPDRDRAMDSICLNTLLLQKMYKILYYSSLEEDLGKDFSEIISKSDKRKEEFDARPL